MSRHIVIGDIHGCFDELMELMDRVALADDDVVVSVGDLVDRGPDSPKVLQWFRERRSAVVLMGNHERKHVRGVFSYSQEITRLQFGEHYAGAVEWMRGLPYSYETPDFVAVHAAWMPGVPRAAQREDVLAGTTAGEKELERALGGDHWHARYDGPKPIVFGHHVVGPEPLVVSAGGRERVFGIDTGACHGGRLTALVVPGFTLHQVDARADHWDIEKRKWQEPVLLARPWLDMGFAKAEREIAGWRDEGGATIERISSWISSMRDLVPRLRERLLEESTRVAAEQLEAHPFKGLLHLARRGRLDLDAVRQRASTPRRVLEMANALGVEAQPWIEA